MRGTVVPNKPWARAQGEGAPFYPAGVPRARVPVRPAVLAWKDGAAHTCTPWPWSWSTRARRAPIPLRRASRCSADEMPRLTRSLKEGLVTPSWLEPSSAFPPSVGTGEGPELGPARASHTGVSDSLGGHGGHGLQAPVTTGGEAVLVAAQVQGLQPRAHGAEGRKGGEGTVRQGGGRPGEQRSCGQSTAGFWCPDPVSLLRRGQRRKDRRRGRRPSPRADLAPRRARHHQSGCGF